MLTPAQVESLALMSPYASGAMIKDIVNESLIVAIRHGRDYVTWPDVIEARVFKVHGMPDGMAATRLEQYETSLHEASHAVATFLLRRRDVIDIATIEKRGPVGGLRQLDPAGRARLRLAHRLGDRRRVRHGLARR